MKCWLQTFNTTSQAEAGLTHTQQDREGERERERLGYIGLARYSIRLKPYFIHTRLKSTAVIFFVVPFIRKGVINFACNVHTYTLTCMHTHILLCVHFFDHSG